MPVPGTEQGEKHEPGQFKLAAGRDKPIEIWQLFAVSIADSLDAIKRDAPHPSQPRQTRGLHVNQGGRVSGGKTPFLRCIGDAGTGHQQAISWRTGCNKTLPSTSVDDSGDIAGLDGSEVVAQGSRPAGGNDGCYGAEFFNLG